jgi:hypothetical protein
MFQFENITPPFSSKSSPVTNKHMRDMDTVETEKMDVV